MAPKAKPKAKPKTRPKTGIKSPQAKSEKKTIFFFHPDLGIGGAERLVIDAAVALQERGYEVVIYTSHCDARHCFDEARDGTLEIRTHTSFLPATFFSRFKILLSTLRQYHLILSISLFSPESLEPDAFFVDQLSAGLPLLRYLFPDTRILFYCHFPDLLLARGRGRWWKRWYRAPFDWLEGWSLGFADMVAVNSRFTGRVVGGLWPGLGGREGLEVVYPCVGTGRRRKEKKERKEENGEDGEDEGLVWRDRDIMLSLNRFEEKKDVGLAIRAFAGLGKHGRKGIRLVVAGGYDNRVQENVTYHKSLVQLADSLDLKSITTKNLVTALGAPDDIDVLFLLSVPNSLKEALLKSARLLIYTPQNEHFGIVPLEAMLAGTPVLAANSGGPLETVVDGVTGWLRSPDQVEGWTAVMDMVLHRQSKHELEQMRRFGRERVMREFSDVQMGERLDHLIEQVATKRRRSSPGLMMLVALVSVLPIIAMMCLVTMYKASHQ